MDQVYKYMVATRCMTYNQAEYIEEALQGFTTQEIDFPVVFIVVDDASTDGEQKVLKDWADKNLQKKDDGTLWKDMSYGQLAASLIIGKPLMNFVILLLNENYYQSGRHSLKMKYISEWFDHAKYNALCEGDDYWTDTKKLQKQVTFLENNSDYGMCYAQCLFFNQEQSKFDELPYGKECCSFEALLSSYNPIATLTAMFRSNLETEFNRLFGEYVFKWKMGDYPRWLFFSHESKVFFMEEIVGVYRVLSNSSSHSSSVYKKIEFDNRFFDIKCFFANYYNIGKCIDIERSHNNHTLSVLCKNGMAKSYFKTLITIAHKNPKTLNIKSFFYWIFLLKNHT